MPASDMSLGSNYHLFLEGIQPMWEDEQNKAGGKWVLTLKPAQRAEKQLDRLWLYTVRSGLLTRRSWPALVRASARRMKSTVPS